MAQYFCHPLGDFRHPLKISLLPPDRNPETLDIILNNTMLIILYLSTRNFYISVCPADFIAIIKLKAWVKDILCKYIIYLYFIVCFCCKINNCNTFGSEILPRRKELTKC